LKAWPTGTADCGQLLALLARRSAAGSTTVVLTAPLTGVTPVALTVAVLTMPMPLVSACTGALIVPSETLLPALPLPLRVQVSVPPAEGQVLEAVQVQPPLLKVAGAAAQKLAGRLSVSCAAVGKSPL